MMNLHTTQSKALDPTEEGFNRMSESTVVICGIARDCGQQLGKLIPKIESLAGKFKDYKVIVVENDSHDNTATTITSWASKNHKVIPILYSLTNLNKKQRNASDGTPGDFDHSRISRIAFARNIYLDELQRHQRADFVIIVDLDIMDFSIPGIANSFGVNEQWDCATSSGLRYTLRSPFMPTVYWDTFAYEPKEGFDGGVQTIADVRSNQKLVRKQIRDCELIPALSAFGGLAIYKNQFLLSQEYDVMANSDSEVPVFCEHVALHRSIARANRGFRLVINPSQDLRYESLLTTFRRNLNTLFHR